MSEIRANVVSSLPEPLTDRELEILACLVEGMSNQEIAEQLHLALRTVKWYNSQIYDKLQVANRREAVALAGSLGLLQPTDISAAPPHNFPTDVTPFIGRRRELAELAYLLAQDENRLITIQGAGGMGKTRLALALARREMYRYSDGAYFVTLAPLGSAELIVLETANTLGYVFSGDVSPKEQLLNFLRPRRLLLVMDNFEHLIQGAALLAEILKAAPQVKIVVTSREKLRLQGETTYPIGGMEVPAEASNGNIFDYDAVALFVDAMRRIRPDMDTDQIDIAAVTRICQLVGGMPLGILLAAAWLDVLALDEIAEEISRSFDMLAAQLHDAPERHHSIRAVFDPTWSRLTSEHQAVFMKLAVFRGGWTREAAQEVAGTSLTDLQTLVNKSLIWRLPTGRYTIHELLRQYAADKLENTGTANDTHDAHSHYYLEFLSQREPGIKGRRQIAVLNEIDNDLENLFTAWRWGVEHDDAEAIGKGVETLHIYSQIRTREHEFEALLRQAQERFTVEAYPRVWGQIAVRYARLMVQGPFTGRWPGRDVFERCLAIAEEYKDPGEIAYCKLSFGPLHLVDEDAHLHTEWDITLIREALAIYEEIGDPYGVAQTLNWIANMLMSDTALRLEYRLRSVATARAAGIANLPAWTLGNIGFTYFDLGRYADSETAFHEALDLMLALGDRKWRTMCQVGWSLAEFFMGNFARARELCEDGLRTAERFGIPHAKVMGLSVLALLHTIEQEVPTQAKERSDEATSLSVGVWHGRLSVLVARMVVGYALGDYQTAWVEAPHGLKDSLASASLPFSITCLTVMAMLLADDGKHARAAELLGLVLNHPASPRGWFENWPLLIRKREQLQAELGADVYTAARERGKSLDLGVVVEQLLAEYAP